MNDVDAMKKKSDQASNEIGSRLLQGWTLLGKSCPNEDCFTPLMKDRNDKMYCVSCKLYIDNGPPTNPSTNQNSNKTTNPTNTTNSGTTNPTNNAMVTENNSTQQKMVIEDGATQNPTTYSSLAMTIDSIIAELEDKLKYANVLLQKKDDVNELSEISTFIHQCGLALSTMIKLRKSL